MKEPLPFSLLISQQEPKNDTCTNPPSVAPVVDPWHQETKDKDSQGPPGNLSIHGLSISSSPAFTIIQGGTNQAAYRSRGTDGEDYAGQVRDKKANYATQGVEDNHSINPVFPKDKGGYLSQGKHIEQDVENPPMKVIGRHETPPPMQMVNGNGSGGPQKHKALI